MDEAVTVLPKVRQAVSTVEIDDNRAMCPLCGCCEMVWEECDNCGGEGVSGHDCGEDCCCCLHPEDNLVCPVCDGAGGWYECDGHCDNNGRHAGRLGDLFMPATPSDRKEKGR